MKRLVLVGGGHSHIEVLRRFGRAAEPNVQITLISPHRYTPYSGMLPGFVAGHYNFDNCHIALAPLVRVAKAKLVNAHAVALNLVDACVECHDGRRVAYDWLSLDIGSTPSLNIPGARDHAVPVKPVEGFLARWNAFIAETSQSVEANVCVIGGGAGGVELLLAMQHRLRTKRARARIVFHLITDTPEILPTFPPRVQAIFKRVLAERKVKVLTNAKIQNVGADIVEIEGQKPVAAEFTVVATSALGAPWLAKTSLTVDARGFVCVDDSLRSISHRNVFAVGDCANQIGRHYPKSGVYAVRQGPILAANLRAALRGRPLAAFVPQAKSLALISTGDRYAVATRGGWAVAGTWVWRLKDWIDRRFVRKYRAVGN